MMREVGRSWEDATREELLRQITCKKDAQTFQPPLSEPA
jgi:hypothetical protein